MSALYNEEIKNIPLYVFDFIVLLYITESSTSDNLIERPEVVTPLFLIVLLSMNALSEFKERNRASLSVF